MFWVIIFIAFLFDSFAESCTSSYFPIIQSYAQALIEPQYHSILLISLLALTRLKNMNIRRAAFASLLLYPLLFCFKIGIGRARPFVLEGPLSFHPFHLDNQFASFPSSHAAALGLFLSIYRPRFWPLWTLLASIRVIQGVHYPSDVVVGFLIGYYLPKFSDLILKRLEKTFPLSWILTR